MAEQLKNILQAQRCSDRRMAEQLNLDEIQAHERALRGSDDGGVAGGDAIVSEDTTQLGSGLGSGPYAIDGPSRVSIAFSPRSWQRTACLWFVAMATVILLLSFLSLPWWLGWFT